MDKFMFFREDEGFTLVELLIVIAIIGLLAGIAVPMFLGQRTKAMMTEAKTNIQIIATANENYYADNGRYSPKTDGTKQYGTGAATALEKELKTLKFGKESDLNFTYKLESCQTGQAFLATATGKPGTQVEGMVFTINQKSELGDVTLVCAP